MEINSKEFTPTKETKEPQNNNVTTNTNPQDCTFTDN
jgi:hypothetical protein